jgi:peptidoglycan/xylan/chitin deacetylase (PgdA/CDA1 family)
MSSTPHRMLGWPVDETVLLTLDFECDYGTALPENTYGAVEHVDRLVDLLERFDISLTTFVQTELFEEHPEAVEALRNADTDVRFHPHSHTHRPREETSVHWEIEESTRRFEEFFGRQPTGYRLPNGNVRASDYEHLGAKGYEFDASLFPSWRPNHFNNTTAPTVPHAIGDHNIVEIPFTVYTSLLRVPTALSYCRLLGRSFTELLTRWPPSVVVFNVHMHDLVNPPSFDDLPRFYRYVYSRNEDGFETLESVLERFKASSYEFRTVDETFDTLSF